jgi:hypothetical protein
MMTKSLARVLLVLAPFGFLTSAALADEIVHFANGAEMTVRSHSLEQNNKTVKLDLGGNSFIAFPMSMVDKIVSAGKDVFLNPSFYPSNQAIAGVSGGTVAGAPGTGSAVADNTIRGGGAPVGFVHQQGAKGAAGVMLGEVADTLPSEVRADSGVAQSMPVRRRVYNPAYSPGPGEPPQVIMPPSAPRGPVRLALGSGGVPGSQTPPAPPPQSGGTQDAPTQSDPAPEDPPDTP